MDQDASITTNTADAFATLTYVPGGAQVAITVSGINGHTVELQARWGADQGGSWDLQKRWTADPTDGESFDCPRPCELRIGIPAGGTGTGNITGRIAWDWPLRRR